MSGLRALCVLIMMALALALVIEATKLQKPFRVPHTIPNVRIPDEQRTLLRQEPSARIQGLTKYELISLDMSSMLISKRDVQTNEAQDDDKSAFPHELTLRVTALGYETALHLKRNEKLFHPNYTETRQVWMNGERRKDLESNEIPTKTRKNCYYTGSARVVGEETTYGTHSAVHKRKVYKEPLEGVAAMNLCNNVLDGVVYAPLPQEVQEEPLDTKTGQSQPKNGVTLIFEPALKHLTADQIEHHITMQTLHRLSTQGDDTNQIIQLENLHIVYQMDDDSSLVPGTCGVGKVQDESHKAHHANERVQLENTFLELKQKALSQAANAFNNSDSGDNLQTQSLQSELWVEVLVANDHARFLQMGSSTESDSAAIMNVVSALYTAAGFYPKLNMVLTAQVTFAIQDPWHIDTGICSGCSESEISVSELLSLWNAWRSGSHAPPHDNGQLFSGFDFEGGVLGYAGVGSMCYPAYSGGIDQTLNGNPPYTGTIVAHELGHNLGSQHDGTGNTCPPSGFIMNAYVSSSQIPTEFSACSKNYISTFTGSSGSVACLENQPSSQWSETPVCGNGLIETGEQCDCGQADCSSVDPCCNGSTCSFVSGAECSFGQPCCHNNCTLVAKEVNKICRSAIDMCDVAETCNGLTGTCPKNGFLGAGRPCTSVFGEGSCYNGVCTSLLRQCQSHNTGSGETYGVCPTQRRLNGGNICGTLYCKPTHYASSTCNYFNNAGATVVTEDGIPCGDKKQCYAGSCVDSNSLVTNFIWKYDDWQTCWACSDTQIRSASCTDKTTLEVVSDDLCSFPEPLTRLCVNPDLGCTGETSFSRSNNIDVLGVKISRTAAILLFVLFVLIYFFIMGLCHHYLRAGIATEEAVEDIHIYIKNLATEDQNNQDQGAELADALQERNDGYLDRDRDRDRDRRVRRRHR